MSERSTAKPTAAPPIRLVVCEKLVIVEDQSPFACAAVAEAFALASAALSFWFWHVREAILAPYQGRDLDVPESLGLTGRVFSEAVPFWALALICCVASGLFYFFGEGWRAGGLFRACFFLLWSLSTLSLGMLCF